MLSDLRIFNIGRVVHTNIILLLKARMMCLNLLFNLHRLIVLLIKFFQNIVTKTDERFRLNLERSFIH